VSCGDAQTLALTVTGKLYGWGCYKDREGKQFFDLPADAPYPDSEESRKKCKRKQITPMLLPFFGPQAQPNRKPDISNSNSNSRAIVTSIQCGSCFNIATCKFLSFPFRSLHSVHSFPYFTFLFL
jgi:hypothetical protein